MQRGGHHRARRTLRSTLATASSWRRSAAASHAASQSFARARCAASTAAANAGAHSGSLDHRASPRRSHASASRRRFLAAYSRSFAFAFASARHRSWRTWLPVPPSGSPQTSHGRRRIGAARWRFAWRKIAERLRPNASATARYEAPETSTSSTAAASGWVQAVQGRGIPSDYTETKRPAPAAGAEVAAPPTTTPPRRDPTIGGGPLRRHQRRVGSSSGQAARRRTLGCPNPLTAAFPLGVRVPIPGPADIMTRGRVSAARSGKG